MSRRVLRRQLGKVWPRMFQRSCLSFKCNILFTRALTPSARASLRPSAQRCREPADSPRALAPQWPPAGPRPGGQRNPEGGTNAEARMSAPKRRGGRKREHTTKAKNTKKQSNKQTTTSDIRSKQKHKTREKRSKGQAAKATEPQAESPVRPLEAPPNSAVAEGRNRPKRHAAHQKREPDG